MDKRIRGRLEKIRRDSIKEARSYPIRLPSIKKIPKGKKRNTLINNAIIIEDAPNSYIISGVCKVLLFVWASKHHSTKNFEPWLRKRDWTFYTRNIKEYFFFKERCKMLNIKVTMEIVKGKDPEDYPIRIEELRKDKNKEELKWGARMSNNLLITIGLVCMLMTFILIGIGIWLQNKTPRRSLGV